MTSHTHKMFADYEIHVQIGLRRKSDRYSSDSLVEIDNTELLAIDERDLRSIFIHAMDEAKTKALSALEIKQTFEREMLALEAGVDIDA